jgi:putative spermidine/putrescine transport system permease protein
MGETFDAAVRVEARGVRSGSHVPGGLLWLMPAAAVLGLLFVFPFLYGLFVSFTPATGAWWGNYAQFFSSEELMRTLTTTMDLAVPASLVTVGLAFPLAYAFRGQSRHETLLVLALVVPIAAGPVVIADGLLTFLGPRGWVSLGLRALHVTTGPIYWTHHYTGLLIAVVASAFPLVFLVLRAYLMSIDEVLLGAAATLGAGPWQRFRYVSWPTCRRGVVVALCLSFVQAFSTFPSAVILGAPTGPTRVIARAAYEAAYEHSDYSMGACIATVMALVQVLVVAVVFGVGRLTSGTRVLSDAPSADHGATSARRPGFVASATMAFGLGQIAFALAAVGVSSFARRWRGTWLPRAWTLSWYPSAWTDLQLAPVLRVTFEVVAVVAIVSMAIGVPAAYVLARSGRRIKRAALGLALLPLAIPPMTYGIPLATLMYRVGLTGTFWGVVLANVVPAVPLVILVLLPFVEPIDPSIESAARILGANKRQVLWHILAPLLASGVSAAAVLVVVRTLGNFELTYLVAGSESQTLVVAVYGAITATGLRAPQLVDAVAMIYVVMVIALVALAMRLVPPDGLAASVRRRSREPVLGVGASPFQDPAA